MNHAKEYLDTKQKLFDKYFGFLNAAQRSAVYCTEGPLLVLAGAGSGKTTVIVNRIANLVLFGRASGDKSVPENAAELLPLMQEAYAHGDSSQVREILRRCAVEPVFPYKILCITFTNKAANEFRERLYATLGEGARDIWAGTFHSVCVRLLRRYIDKIGYKNDFTIYDADDSKRLITRILKEMDIAESVLSPRHALALISHAKENGLTPADEAQDIARDQHKTRYVEAYERYQKQLRDANALDFDDIIMLTCRLFDEQPEVLERCRAMFEYILVDEYQDTNRSQSRLVGMLAGEKRNVCVVGDDDQSIYSFRGAVIDNILDFDKEYPNAKVIRLEQNYRSVGYILKAANGIIGNNTGRRGKNLWTEAADGERVHIRHFLTQAEEAAFICDEVANAVAEGAKYSDFAVLYRVNALSNTLETALARKRIPYKIYGGLRFYERREIKDILAYLSVVSNPADSVRLRRILNVPRRSIGDTTIGKIASLAEERGVPMFEIIGSASRCDGLQRVAPKLERFAGLINGLRDYSADHTVSQTVRQAIEASGYLEMLAEEDDNSEEREQNVMELVSSAQLFEETAEDASLAAFLNEISLVSDLDSYDSAEDALVLMTVHSAKGLEFGTVFVPGFEEGLFPSTQSLSDGDRGLEEERRLAYVCVTRAKKKLYLLHTGARLLYGRTETRQISRFAGEIPFDCCDRGSGRPNAQAHTVPGARVIRHNESRQAFLNNIRASEPKPDTAALIPAGRRVMHPMFGQGTVLSASPMGGDVLYEIDFDNGSKKRLMGNFAKLKRLD
ncbi:MAG: UvrD-helicase domain-containing protein [Clostridia bacterium]|nr:UvrD-helicase domain-containing protein [Clostridia bacterium]